MGYGDIARIRRELRERLMAERFDGVWDVLNSLRRLAEDHDELRSEHARWRMRFELLSGGGTIKN